MATFAEEMVEKYRTLLADSAGLKTVTVDGQSVTYGELEERLRYWESRVGSESGRRPRAATIKLSSGF